MRLESRSASFSKNKQTQSEARQIIAKKDTRTKSIRKVTVGSLQPGDLLKEGLGEQKCAIFGFASGGAVVNSKKKLLKHVGRVPLLLYQRLCLSHILHAFSAHC